MGELKNNIRHIKMEKTDSYAIVKRLFSLLKLDKKEIYEIYAFSFIISIINLSLPLGIQSIINTIQSGLVSNYWLLLVFIVIIGAAFVGIMQAIQLRITENIQQKIYARSAFEFAYRLPIIKNKELKNKYLPEIANRFFDTINIQKGLSKLLSDISTASLQILFALFILSMYHPSFLLMSVFLILVFYIIFKSSGVKGLETSLMESKYKYKTAQWLEDIARTLYTFKLAGKTDIHLSKTDTLVSNYLHYREKHFKVLIFQFLNLVAFKVFVVAILVIIGGLLVIERKINLGQFVASEIIILLIMSNMEKLITSLETAYDVLTAVEKIGQVTDLELENEKENNHNFVSDNHALKVEFKNIFYHYENNKTAILKNINLTIEPYEKICISGFSSSGKSTLISLLSGISSPSKGEVIINNQNINDIYPPEYSAIMGHSFQLDRVFSGTILENVSLNKENVSFKDVTWAIEKVGLKEMIKTLPDGYNTHISSNYNQFSRNTIQKIILARAIVNKPKLLLLEYAFEYFGLQTKKDLIDFICSNDNPWTVVAASNDPTIAQACDKVIILKDGEITHQGKFEDLIKIPEIQNLYNA